MAMIGDDLSIPIAVFSALVSCGSLYHSFANRQKAKMREFSLLQIWSITARIFGIVLIRLVYHSALDLAVLHLISNLVVIYSSFGVLWALIIDCDILFIYNILDERLTPRRISFMRATLIIAFIIQQSLVFTKSISDISGQQFFYLYSINGYANVCINVLFLLFDSSVCIYMFRTIFDWNKHNKKEQVKTKYHNAYNLLSVILFLDWAAVGITILELEILDASYTITLNIVIQSIFGIHAAMIPLVFEGLKDLALAGRPRKTVDLKVGGDGGGGGGSEDKKEEAALVVIAASSIDDIDDKLTENMSGLIALRPE